MFSMIRLRKKTRASFQTQNRVFLCDEIAVPFCLGIFRPRIYLPSSLTPQEREYIILHEKYHIKRPDHIIKLAAFLALCLHWFNPLIWIAYILAGNDMEMSCDEAVLKQMDRDIRAEYIRNAGDASNLYKIDAANTLWGEGRNNYGQLAQNTQDYAFYNDPVKIAEQVIHVDFSQKGLWSF